MKLPFFTPLLGAATVKAFHCTTFNTSLTIPITSFQPAFPPFESHYQSVAFLGAITASNASTASPFSGSVNLTETFTINAQYCTPSAPINSSTTVQILSHGLGFDKSYWNFGGPDSEYNYVRAATAAGSATLLYDRIGNGASSTVDPYTIQQAQVELAVLIALTQKLRAGTLDPCVPKSSEKVVHIGHSFGSSISHALAATAPELTDGVVLTGYSTNASGVGTFLVSSLFHLAKENLPARFGNWSTGSLTWGDELANQYNFLAYPFFDPTVLAYAEAHKFPFSIGELLTQSLLDLNASAFTGPALIISGDADRIFCAGDCYGNLDNSAPLFASAKPFSTYIQPHTGHGMNLHFNASAMYGVIQTFLGENL